MPPKQKTIQHKNKTSSRKTKGKTPNLRKYGAFGVMRRSTCEAEKRDLKDKVNRCGEEQTETKNIKNKCCENYAQFKSLADKREKDNKILDEQYFKLNERYQDILNAHRIHEKDFQKLQNENERKDQKYKELETQLYKMREKYDDVFMKYKNSIERYKTLHVHCKSLSSKYQILKNKQDSGVSQTTTSTRKS